MKLSIVPLRLSTAWPIAEGAAHSARLLTLVLTVCTTAQIAGIAEIDAAFFAIEVASSARMALFASSLRSPSLPVPHFCHGCGALTFVKALAHKAVGLTAHVLFILQCSNYLFSVRL